MKIVFMGSTQFSADILDELARHFDVIAAYTQPDRVRGRGNKLVPTPVKELATSLGIEVRTPTTFKEPAEVDALKELDPDIICVAAYGMLLPESVLEVPKDGCINVHASLLPRWRGAAPIERSILAGDDYTGVTIMKMETGLDTGDYCVERKIPIGDKTAEQLSDELSLIGAQALISALGKIESGEAKWTSQDEKHVTYASKLEKGELDLYPSYSTARNIRNVRASTPPHPSKATIGDKVCIIDEVKPLDNSKDRPFEEDSTADPQGRYLIKDGRLFLGSVDGWLEVTSIKPTGKRLMDVKDFLRGANLPSAGNWSAPR